MDAGHSSVPAGPVSLALNERPRSYVNCSLHRSCPRGPKGKVELLEKNAGMPSVSCSLLLQGQHMVPPAFPSSPTAHSMSC